MTALARRHHNPDVEPERPGYSVRQDKLGWWWTDQGWAKSYKLAKVYARIEDARRASTVLHGTIVTGVPRFNGHVIEWKENPT